jgi:hypothetical protein
MIVAAHQPHYLPWLGYLDKIARADVFVVMDDLQFEAQNFQNRQRVKLSHGPAWLTVPVRRGTQLDRICDKQIIASCNPRHHWQHQHWNTILYNYRGAPYFARYADELREVYTRPWERLVDLDRRMLELAVSWLAIETPILAASQLGLRGAKTDRLLDMCTKLQADVYLTGSGGSAGYLDAAKLRSAGVDVEWQQFAHPVYPQRHARAGFCSHLGFLDLVLNCGPASREILLGTAQPIAAPAVEILLEVAS